MNINKTEPSLIFPFNRSIRQVKENSLNQHGIVFWLTGLPSSGKTTIGAGFEEELITNHHTAILLDGDNIRHGLNKDLGFSDKDRMENIRRVAELSKILVENGNIVICCFVSPAKAMRNLAKEIISEPDFKEIYIKSNIETCIERDVKGLYEASRQGKILQLTGVDSTYEEPESPDLIIDTAKHSIESAVGLLKDYALPFITR